MPPPITENPYPRGPIIQGGSASQLRKLRDAYYGIYWIIAGTVVTWILPQVLIEVLVGTDGENADLGIAIIGGAGLLMLIVNFFIAFRYARMVAQAKSKPTGYAVALSLGTAVLSPCCFGLVGCIVIQQAVANEVKKYGIENKFLGMKKADFDRVIEALERSGRP